MKKKKAKPLHKLELLRYNETFQVRVNKLRAKWSVPPGGFGSLAEYRKWEQKVRANKDDGFIVSDIQDLRHSLKLNSVFDTLFLWFYITQTEQCLNHTIPTDKLRTQLRIEGLDLQIIVHNVNVATTKEDWLTLWPQVQKFKNFLPQNGTKKRSRSMDNLEIAKFIYEQHQDGVKHKDIAIQVRKKWGLSANHDASWISKQVQRFKEQIKKDS